MVKIAEAVVVSKHLEFPGKLDRTGWQAPAKEMTIEQWLEIGQVLREMSTGVAWWWGDWCNYGEGKYGERYSQALEVTDLLYGTLATASWVCRRITPLERRDTLSFSHHRAVAPIESAEARQKWLDTAETNGWSSKMLAYEIRKAEKGEGGSSGKMMHICPNCGTKFTNEEEVQAKKEAKASEKKPKGSKPSKPPF